MPRLYIRVLSEAVELPDDERYELAVQWLIKEQDGEVRAGGVTDYRGISDLIDPDVDWLGNPDNIVVFVPSQFVLMVGCEVPGKNAAQIRRALPFAAEEFVASDIESMHIAHGAIKAGKPVYCDIISHDIMAGWRAAFADLGLNPGYFIADAQMLPREDGVVSTLFEGDSVLVASATQAAALDRDSLVFAVNSLAPERIVAVNGTLTDIERGQLDKIAEIESIAGTGHGVLEYLADRFQFATVTSPFPFINLLQGPYHVVRPRSASGSRWRTVALLAAAWAAIAFVGLIAQGWWASSEADRLEGEGFAFYKRVFPRESQPVGIEQLRRRMAAKLGQQVDDIGAAGAFVGLLAQFSNVLDAGAAVSSINYAGQREELTVEVMLDSYDDLETIKTELAQSGVGLEVASAEQEERGVRSRLRVRYAE